MVKKGDKAPDFTLQNQNEKEISLIDYLGKWVVLYFYPKDNTPGCTKEAGDFTAALGDYEQLDAEILGVSPDSVSSHQKFTKNYNLKIALLSDPDKSVHKAYGAWGIKKNYGKEYEGVIRSTFLISPDGKIAEIWTNVKVRTKHKSGEVRHVDIVKNRLEELRS